MSDEIEMAIDRSSRTVGEGLQAVAFSLDSLDAGDVSQALERIATAIDGLADAIATLADANVEAAKIRRGGE